jgi:hypothetical protein
MEDNEQHLWPSESSLPLDTRGYAVSPNKTVRASFRHPSLVGSVESPGSPESSGETPELPASALGIGGTHVSGTNGPPTVSQGSQRPVQHVAQTLTPDQLMAWANAKEQDFMNQRQDTSTAVDPALIRTGGAQYVTAPKPIGSEVPDWLHSYMSKQSDADVAHQKNSDERARVMAMRDAQGRNGH